MLYVYVIHCYYHTNAPLVSPPSPLLFFRRHLVSGALRSRGVSHRARPPRQNSRKRRGGGSLVTGAPAGAARRGGAPGVYYLEGRAARRRPASPPAQSAALPGPAHSPRRGDIYYPIHAIRPSFTPAAGGSQVPGLPGTWSVKGAGRAGPPSSWASVHAEAAFFTAPLRRRRPATPFVEPRRPSRSVSVGHT